ncbi:MAG: lipoyl(octanoyl) transferase LipB [Betaproteobacteria bacterium]|nr:lipoyl(octanoyl) transferase LipB [Betaproteobacteria bacterium]
MNPTPHGQRAGVGARHEPAIRALGRAEYEPVWRAMQAFTKARDAATPDELWFVEHPPVFTLGLAAKPEHVLDAQSIPVVRIDRGGQVTYHGPGQLVAYVLLDLKRAGLGVKDLVRRLEQSVIEVLAGYNIAGERRPGMPGVYVSGAKIAAIGLRVSRGCSFHGVAFNVNADLAAFSRINPCGYPGLAATRLADLGVRDTMAAVQQRWQATLLDALFAP